MEGHKRLNVRPSEGAAATDSALGNAALSRNQTNDFRSSHRAAIDWRVSGSRTLLANQGPPFGRLQARRFFSLGL